MSKLVFLSAILACSTITFAVRPEPALPVAQKVETVRTTVTGVGKTRSEAGNNARANASRIARFGYRVVNESANGGGTNWTVVLTIEYKK